MRLPGPDVSVVSDGVRPAAPADLRRSCERLREDVARLELPLSLPGVDDARRELVALLSQLDDYLLPRLRRIDAPLLAVVGGSTGAGKSTLVNSLVRRVVTRSGVLRPTTRSPVLVHHPFDSGAFLTQRILPGFARVTSEAPEPQQPVDVDAPRVTALRLVPDDGLAPGLAIIDAPDIDSLVETNRDLAVQLFAAADLWIFVTTASRYADAVPWDSLKTAVDRGVAVAVVLDRVPPEAMEEVRVHLATMLRDQGLSTAPMFTIPETTRDADGFVPEEVVEPLHGWLSRLARDSRSRDVVVRRTLVGALDSLHQRVTLLTGATQAQAEAEALLRAAVTDAFDGATARWRTGAGDGGVLRGEVLGRWQEYVGGGEAFRGFDGTLGRLRGRMRLALRGRPSPAGPLADALARALVARAVTLVEGAVDDVVSRWRAHPAGPALLAAVGSAGVAGSVGAAGRPSGGAGSSGVAGSAGVVGPAGSGAAAGPAGAGAGVLSAGFADRVARVVRDWQSGVQDAVRSTVADRADLRSAVFGVEGLGVILQVSTLADPPAREPATDPGEQPGPGGAATRSGDPATGPGGAAAGPGDPAVVALRLLTAVLGAEVVTMVPSARASLEARVLDLFTGERARFETVLNDAAVNGDVAAVLRGHVRAIEGAR